VFYQTVSLAGAFLILTAYLLSQRGRLGPRDRAYNLMNLVGALLLLWVAIVDWRWGFILLEALWAVASIPPLLRPPALTEA
jgi:Na+-translocating ferredoxin:NAD+ oxidoreductase RnfD subunit